MEQKKTEETVTRTFRVNTEWDELLNKQAQWQGISVSNLLDQIVRRYVTTELFQIHSPVTSMENKTFGKLLEKISEDEIKDLGREAGRSLPEEEILKRGLVNSFPSYVWLMKEVFGRYGGWFSVDQYATQDENVLHLKHFLDMKWSIYLSNFFSSMFDTNLNIEIKAELREESVTLYIPKKQIKASEPRPHVLKKE